MSIKDKIKDIVAFLGVRYEEKAKRQKEVLEFMKWGITNIPANIRTKIGTLNKVTHNYTTQNYGIEFNIKDYNYWKNELSLRPDILFIEPEKIEKMTLRKLIDLSTEEYLENKTELEEVISQIDKLYAN